MLKFLRLLLVALIAALPVAPAFAQDAPVPETRGAETAPLPPADAARALVRILADETARARLIAELERMAEPAAVPPAVGEAAAPATPEVAPAAPLPEDSSLARQLGEYTQIVASDAFAIVSKVGTGLLNLLRLFDGSVSVDWERLGEQLVRLTLLGLVVFGATYAVQWVMHWPIGVLERRAAGRSPLRRLLPVLGMVVLNLVAIGMGWLAAVAYLVAYSPNGQIQLIEGIFVNAFLLTQLVKLGFRSLLQPLRPGLRLPPMSDAVARYWYFRIARLTEFVAYGVMLVFPIVNATAGFAVGLGVRMMVVVVALAFVVALVLRNRQEVRHGLTDAAARVQSRALAAILAMLAHVWHLLVLGYVLVAFVVWVTRPFDAISYMAGSTVQTLVVLAIGGLVMGLLNRTISNGIRLPADVRRALPLLEPRVNLLVPAFLRLVRLIIAVAVVAGALEAWDLVDIGGWASTEAGANLLSRFASALLVVIVAMVLWIAATAWIEFRLSPASGKVSTARARTLFSLFRNALTIVILVIGTMLALSQLGVDIAPLIAGAGVVGLAVGFGSQKLVQDIITGAFIQFENAMNEGDVVTVAGISGVVDRLTIRSVALRDLDGVYHVIPFSSVDSVSNFMRGFAYHVANMGVAYKEDVGEVKRLMNVAFERLMETEHATSILEPLEMHGVVEFAASAVVIRARIKTLPGQQWAVGRAYNEWLKRVFDEHGVEIPFPQTTVWFAKDDGGPLDEAAAERPRLTEDRPAAAGTSSGSGNAAPARTLDVPESPDGQNGRS